ncbi:unknown [Anaerotruncus sp. CAG:390]|nr:unknown [Anaerotruncus sp. CAG:390]
MHRRNKGRYGEKLPHGQTALRRRWLRQDGGSTARRVQVRCGRQAVRHFSADHDSRLSALSDGAQKNRGLPGRGAYALALLLEKGDRGYSERSAPRQCRYSRRHAQTHIKRCSVPRPRADNNRRGATLRRGSKGEAQGALSEGRRSDADRDAHTEDAQHGALRHTRHVNTRRSAARPLAGADLCCRAQSRDARAGDERGAQARRTGILSAQPR